MRFEFWRNELIEYVQSGNDNSLRASAIGILSGEYLKSNDPAVGRAIAEFVVDESVSVDLRKFAYLCLLEVSDFSYKDYPDLETFVFPELVNRELLDHFLGKTTSP